MTSKVSEEESKQKLTIWIYYSSFGVQRIDIKSNFLNYTKIILLLTLERHNCMEKTEILMKLGT